MNKVIFLLAFSVLLLVPVSQNVFATHPEVCPSGGFLNTNPAFSVSGNTNYCQAFVDLFNQGSCSPSPYSSEIVDINGLPGIASCVALPITHETLQNQCQDNSVLVNNHCVPDFPTICTGGSVQSGITCIAQAMNNLIGGTLLETNTLPLLVGAIGVNPVITGLVGITIAGIVGQTAWFVHRRRIKSENR